MGKPTGFIEFLRELPSELTPLDRLHNWDEFHLPMPEINSAIRQPVVWIVVHHFVTREP